jgi:hypothetical protein
MLAVATDLKFVELFKYFAPLLQFLGRGAIEDEEYQCAS